MKRNLTLSWLAITIITLFSFQTLAKEFKGVITYKITVEGSAVTDEMKTMMPKTMVMSIAGNKSRSEMVMSMGKTISITDGDAKTAITLMDMMGQKIAIQSTYEEIMKEIGDSPEAILVSMCEYGSFPVFQKSSDLYFVDSESGEYTKLSSNSDDSDSWHSWSSNGRWIVFASKRLDGLFGRLFFAHVNAEGQVAKPFLLPQENPRFYETCYQNYNAPEFAIKAVSVSQQAFLKAIYEDETIPVKADPRSPRPDASPVPVGPLE